MRMHWTGRASCWRRWDREANRIAGGAVLALALSCSGNLRHSQETESYGFMSIDSGYVWARGPWPEVQASSDPDEVIDQLCPAIMRLDRATARDFGQEYCGVIYSRGDGIYRTTHPSPLGEPQLRGETKQKSCFPVRRVVDPEAKVTPILADFHSHPWFPSPLSQQDKMAANQLYFLKIQFDSACQIQKIVPYLDRPDAPGEVYSRRGKRWVLIGIIKPSNKAAGIVTPVGGLD
ncbi:hypothetical protein [Myxococcus xanthus]|uniref:hypothetical protein n=1 Tax=Myxococcus xanthus TaxID=34 RepID=UPI00112CCFF8|nr:hypothetical protein BHS05_00860 [Myxococcus xanthus]